MNAVSGLIITIPEAEPFVSSWRARYDPNARDGVPAHVTVLFPFKPYDAIDATDMRALGAIFSAQPSFELTLFEIGRFPGVLWLAPRPSDPVNGLASALGKLFPDFPPYQGAFDNVIPHLTVALAEESVLDEIEADLRGRLAAPIRSCVRQCSLYSRDGDVWRHRTDFALGK